MTFLEWLESRGHDLDELTDEQRTAFAEEFLAELRSDTGEDIGESCEDSDSFMRAATLGPDSLDEDARSVTAILATDSRVPMLDWRTLSVVDEVLRADGVVMPKTGQLPMLDTHSRYSVESQLGSIRDLRVEGGNLMGRLVFAEDARSDDAWKKVKAGHVTDMSAGYRVLNYTDIPAGRSESVNGVSYTAGKRTLRVSTAWEPREASLCPIGQDRLAKIRSAGFPTGSRHRSRTHGEEVAVEFKKWLQGRGLTEDAFQAMDKAKQDELRAEYDADQARAATPPATPAAPAPAAPAAPAAPSPDAEALRAEGARLERERVQAIRSEAAGLDIDAEVVERAISNGLDIESARGAFLESLRTRTASLGMPNINTRNAGAEATEDALAAGMELRCNVPVGNTDNGNTATIGTRRAEQGDQFRDMSMLDFCREAIRLSGMNVPRSRDEIIRRAVSTMSLPNLFGNVANKVLLAGYNAAPNTSMQWCDIKEVPDFKETTLARMGDASDLQQVGPGGEIKDGTMSEWAEKAALETWARMFSVTRQDIINDDMSVLMDIPKKLGAAAMRLIDDRVYTVLLANGTLNDGTAIFASGHSNYNASQALNDAGLSAARAAMRKQTDLGGSPLNLEPRYLIVPPDLEDTALRLVRSREIMKVGDDESLHGTYNPNQNRFQVISEPRLSNDNYTGYDDDGWYLACSPDQAGTMAIMFLTGKREPTVEQVAMDPRVLGVSWRVYFDVQAKAEDYRGMTYYKAD